MITIQDRSPRCKRPYHQPTCDQGYEAAKAGKPLTQLDVDVPFDPSGRMAWLVGWEAGGGVVTRGIVVTQHMRLEERKAEILKELETIESQLKQFAETQEVKP